jgi:hypothetical protein
VEGWLQTCLQILYDTDLVSPQILQSFGRNVLRSYRVQPSYHCTVVFSFLSLLKHQVELRSTRLIICSDGLQLQSHVSLAVLTVGLSNHVICLTFKHAHYSDNTVILHLSIAGLNPARVIEVRMLLASLQP